MQWKRYTKKSKAKPKHKQQERDREDTQSSKTDIVDLNRTSANQYQPSPPDSNLIWT